MPHGNSHKNENLHHLYEIWDTQEEEVYKYGISDDPIEDDGLSARLCYYFSLFNLVANFFRFIGKIILTNIDGRKNAERIENEYINDHQVTYGHRPRGNPKKQRRRR